MKDPDGEPIELEVFGDPDAPQCIDGVCQIPGIPGGDSAADEAARVAVAGVERCD